jgi:hypothetical protein
MDWFSVIFWTVACMLSSPIWSTLLWHLNAEAVASNQVRAAYFQGYTFERVKWQRIRNGFQKIWNYPSFSTQRRSWPFLDL